jgi:uncharacterized protein YdiU (UPF0061 family)
MNIRHIIITLVCFLLTGCISPSLFSDGELEARNHMAMAAEKEKSSTFQAAIKTYTEISETYPGTSVYKPAVWRAAILNLHPDNPDINTTSAQEWLHLYLKLPLSSAEKEMADVCLGFIQQTNTDRDERDKLLSLIEQQKKDRENLIQKLKHSRAELEQARRQLKKLRSYEKELSILKDKLEKMKAIDVQIHNNKIKQ